MRKLKWMLLLFWLPLHALYNGNPSFPGMPEKGIFTKGTEWWGFKAGYEVDFTFYKDVKLTQRESSVRDRFDQYYSFKQYGVLTFNMSDRFELYALLGSMQVSLAQRPTSTTNIEYHSSNAFSWGIGGRVILVYWAEMLMGVNALYMASTLPFDAIIQNGVNRRIGSSHLDYDEWQVGISFSREIGVFVPYIGLAYASMDSCLKSPPRQSSLFNPKSENLKNRQPFLLVLGFGMAKEYGINLNLESRLIGEQALTLSADVRF